MGETEIDLLARETRDHEPRVALMAGPAGTEVIARLVPQAANRLVAGGRLIMEISPMIEEMNIIKETMQVREDSLLNALLEAQTEAQANYIINKIEQLDMDRELALLRVQVRFARLNGLFELERELEGLIASMAGTDLAMLR